ncbi:hypothetical protein [Hymenobacter sp.]|uniref:hypothetical protein n=1 Tax=Hymenobacter sp. TaxID=1898978 RepID=UPI00286D3958|nr:hypothetical protein [Hymenobacter sp.]
MAALPALGQDANVQPMPWPARRASIGVLGTYNAVGLQADYRFAKSWGVKLAGVRQFGYERPAEYGRAGIGLLTYSFPTRSQLVEPVVGVGAVRTVYHWALAGRSGNVTDWNVGGGFGANLRFSDRFRTGLNIFLVNGFRAEYQAGDMVVTSRRLVAFPTLTLDVLL